MKGIKKVIAAAAFMLAIVAFSACNQHMCPAYSQVDNAEEQVVNS